MMKLDHYRVVGSAMEEPVVPPDVLEDRTRGVNLGATIELQAAKLSDLALSHEVEDVEDKAAAGLGPQRGYGGGVCGQDRRNRVTDRILQRPQ